MRINSFVQIFSYIAVIQSAWVVTVLANDLEILSSIRTQCMERVEDDRVVDTDIRYLMVQFASATHEFKLALRAAELIGNENLRNDSMALIALNMGTETRRLDEALEYLPTQSRVSELAAGRLAAHAADQNDYTTVDRCLGRIKDNERATVACCTVALVSASRFDFAKAKAYLSIAVKRINEDNVSTATLAKVAITAVALQNDDSRDELVANILARVSTGTEDIIFINDDLSSIAAAALQTGRIELALTITDMIRDDEIHDDLMRRIGLRKVSTGNHPGAMQFVRNLGGNSWWRDDVCGTAATAYARASNISGASACLTEISDPVTKALASGRVARVYAECGEKERALDVLASSRQELESSSIQGVRRSLGLANLAFAYRLASESKQSTLLFDAAEKQLSAAEIPTSEIGFVDFTSAWLDVARLQIEVNDLARARTCLRRSMAYWAERDRFDVARLKFNCLREAATLLLQAGDMTGAVQCCQISKFSLERRWLWRQVSGDCARIVNPVTALQFADKGEDATVVLDARLAVTIGILERLKIGYLRIDISPQFNGLRDE